MLPVQPITHSQALQRRAEAIALAFEPEASGKLPQIIEDLIAAWDAWDEITRELEHDPADEPLLDDAELEPWLVSAHLEGGGGHELPNDREIAALQAIGKGAPILRKLWDDDGDLTEEWVDAFGAVHMKPIACGVTRYCKPQFAERAA